MAPPAAVLSVLVTANTSQATRGIMRFNTQLSATEASSNKALGAVKTLAKGASIGAAGGLAYAVKKAADFEQQLDSLGSVSGATARDMERFRKQAMKAGADTKFSALDAAEAQTELAKGGLSVRNIMRGGLKSALALAAAGEMDLADAASTTANAMNLFGLKGKDSIKVADELATAANATTADVSDFAMALKQGGSVAKTAGLSFTETVLSLEALAKSGIKNSDAGTSLKTALIQLIKPTNKQADMADDLGLKFINAAGNMKSMAQISAMLRDKLGDQTAAQRTATLATLAGTDGVRTLTSLYDAGPAKLEKWKQGLEKSGTAAKVAAEKQDNLKGKLENLQGSIETTAIAIGTKFLPMLTKAAEDITTVINDPKLSGSEKFDKLAEMAGKALTAAMPVVAKAAAKLGGAAIHAFFTAWRNSDLLTKLIVGGALFAKMGGFGAFRTLGTKAGDQMGEGAAKGMETRMGRAKSRFAAIGKGVLGAALLAGVADAASSTDLKLGDRIQRGLSTATLGIIPDVADPSKKVEEIKAKLRSGKIKFSDFVDTKSLTDEQRATVARFVALRGEAQRAFGPAIVMSVTAKAGDFTRIRNEFDRLRNGGVFTIKDLRATVDSQMALISRSMGLHSKAGSAAVRTNTKLALQTVKALMADGTISARTGMREIARIMKSQSAAGKNAVGTNFGTAIGLIRKSMRDGKTAVGQGMQLITDLFYQQAVQFGISKKSARADANRRAYEISHPSLEQTSGRQRGGHISDGKLTGDSVPAMLERGEYVLNRKAVSKVGRGQLDALNYGAAPRFQSGGIVALGRTLQRQGYEVGEHPAFGGVHPVHVPGSYHYKGMALDVNDDDAPGGEMRSLDKLYGRLKGKKGVVELLWRVANHFDHLHVAMSGGDGSLAGGGGSAVKQIGKVGVKGPDSLMKTVIQSALDRTRNAANERLASLASTAGAGVEGGEKFKGGAGGSYDKGRLKNIWRQAGGRPASSNIAAAIALAESSGNPNSENHNSNGTIDRGLWQINSIHGAKSTFDPLANARGAVSISGNGSNWRPWVVYNTGAYRKYLQKGGMAEMASGGLAGQLTGTLNTLATQPNGKKGNAKKLKKAQAKKLSALMKRIRGIKLPKTDADINKYTNQANLYADYANRAQALTVDGGPQGLVAGKNETQWVQEQLTALFHLRNTLIRAQDRLAAQRERVAELLEIARKRYAKVQKQIAQAAEAKKILEKQLSKAKKPETKKALKRSIAQIEKDQRSNVKVRSALKDKIIPGLKDKHSGITTRRDEVVQQITEVQGAGSPMGVLKSLPALGVLGGSIFDAQIRLRDLNLPKITDTATGDTGRADNLAELLREANLRTSVSQKQYDVFRGMPDFGGVFHGGGVVPGRSGAEKMAVVQAGEGVFTRDQMDAMGGGDVHIHVAPGMEWLRQFISVEYDRNSKRTTRGGRAPLPGAGGR